MATAHEQTRRMAIICVAGFVVLNAAFYVLSSSYFDAHREIVAGVGSVSTYSPAQMTQVRIWFAVFSGVVAVFGFAAGRWPRATGHLLAVVFGVVDLVSAVRGFSQSAPEVLSMVWLVAGCLLLVLAHYSYRHRSRPAWAFLVAMCGVFAVAELFGAPKISRALDISLWLTMISPGLKAVAAAALASVRGEYVEHVSVPA